jgi:predicted nucleic acid-binding protein
MNIVVDALVIIAVIANKPQREVLIGVTKGVDLLAPPSVHWEIGNAFSAMLRRRRVTLAEVPKAIEVYRRIPIRFVEVKLEDALRVAAEAGIYAYDACVIGCAQKYRAALIFCPWDYPDEKTALRGLLSSGPAIRAIQSRGEEVVRDVVLRVLAPFKTSTGGYYLTNNYRYLIATA